MSSFVWTCVDLQLDGAQLRHVAIGVTVVAALLMVSRIRYNSFKGARGPRGDRVPFFAIVVVVAVLIALVLDPPKVLLAAFALYALSGPALWLRRRRGA
jgi:CDP-diacylglycerol--serine O-phosphatidyltransferase